ncbi:MAG: hypothetical protein ABH828_02300 [archaeon]
MGTQLDLFKQNQKIHINDVIQKNTKPATSKDPQQMKQFLYDGNNLPTSFEKGTQDKINLLQHHFKKFRTGETQELSLKRYTPEDIGKIYASVRSFYMKKYPL